MTDFRALCAELVDDLELCDWPYKLKETIRADINRACAALADEPASVAGQPSDADLLKLAQQYSVVYLLSDGSACHPFQEGYDMRNDVLNFARAVLARWGTPNFAETRSSLGDAPQPPVDGEVAELVEWLREQLDVCLQAPWTPGIKHFGRAANLLERLSPPQPVPVNERLPGPKDCDTEGRCWWWQPSHPEGGYLEGWMLRPRFWGVGHYDLDDRLTHTHWLPAHALPLPTAND